MSDTSGFRKLGEGFAYEVLDKIAIDELHIRTGTAIDSTGLRQTIRNKSKRIRIKIIILCAIRSVLLKITVCDCYLCIVFDVNSTTMTNTDGSTFRAIKDNYLVIVSYFAKAAFARLTGHTGSSNACDEITTVEDYTRIVGYIYRSTIAVTIS